MTDNTQPLALMLADRLHHEQPTVLRIDAEHAGEVLRRQHARIAELEAQLESVTAGAGSEPVAWLVCTEEGDPDMVFLSQHEAQQYLEDDERPTPLYTHPSPPEGMVGGWQDIATAPKDGTRFVAVGNNYGLDSETQHTCIAQWFRGCWMEVSDWNEASELKYLTHWMPLPPLPGSAASATADSVLAPAATCPTCEAPCTTTVNMRGGEHGWGTTDLERTVYHYAPAPAAGNVLEDAARLDWLLLHISGAEFRRIGVHYSGNARRADVDAARKQGDTP